MSAYEKDSLGFSQNPIKYSPLQSRLYAINIKAFMRHICINILSFARGTIKIYTKM